MAVYRAALAALGSHADAEDAAQDAFLVAFRRLDTFRGDASFKTWLLTIAWHQAINRRRGLVRMWRWMWQPAGETVDEQEPMATVAAADPSPEQAIVHAELERAVRREILALSPK